MAERNLLREGFVFNTLTPAGAISGTQVVSPQEINLLADGNVSSTALLVSGTKQTVLDADLGARWKINRIELYTDESSSSRFEMEVSENNLEFRPLTMTGSSGLWVGSLPLATTSGAPRYIRYRHHPLSNTLVREWIVVNDDTLVDFGSDGNQLSLEIDDAPIGRPSDLVETLTVKNNHSKSAEGFVLVDRTFNSAENEIEISTSPNGPWLGRNSSLSNQPTNVPWEQGKFFNTRVVPSGSLFHNFTNGLSNGWSMTGANQSIVDGRLQGQTINQTPLAFISSEFVPFTNNQTYEGALALNANKFVFRARDVDNVRVRARVQTPLQLPNILEGPRLFWKTEQNVEATPSTFRNDLSVLSTAGTAITGGFQDFLFPVSEVPTWSGSIRGLGFRPFTVATGTNIIFDIQEIGAFSSQANSVSLDFNPVPSGSFLLPLPFDESINDGVNRTVISIRHRVTQDCIITKVGTYVNLTGDPSIFLARRLPGGNFPLPGNNFTVPYGVSTLGESTTSQTGLHEFPVFWQALKGDFICAVDDQGPSEGFRYLPGTAGDAFVSVSGFNPQDSLANLASAININTFVSTDRNYLIYYEAIPTEIGGYKSSGTYRTPVFDLNHTSPLADLNFNSLVPNGTSIDTSGQTGFDTVRARASASPARFGLRLGETGTVSGTNQTIGLLLNENELFTTASKNDQQINLQNQTTSVDENKFIQNIGGAIMYHENNDELWVLDCALSGTDPFLNTDARPTWDVYNPTTGSYVRTDHLKGNINYGYDGQNGLSTGDVRGFVPVGLAADYSRNEIYILQKNPCFTVGAGEYFGLVTDLQGNFKEVFARSGAMGLSTQGTLGVPPTERTFDTMIGCTYASNLQDPTVLTSSGRNGVFFLLHDNEINIPVEGFRGRKITAIRNGNDIGARNLGVINTVNVSSIPGLGFTSGDHNTPTGIVYNPTDGLLYLHFDNVTGLYSGANKKPEFMAVRPSFNPSTSLIEYALSTVSGTAFGTAPDVNGFSKQYRGADGTGSGLVGGWPPIVSRSPDFTMAIAHNKNRDTFAILRSYVAERAVAFPKDFSVGLNDGPLNRRELSFLFECGVGNRSQLVQASIPSTFDGIWGTASGTLQFQEIAIEGINFPTGRFVQVEYQLNSNPQQTATPSLFNSNIAQGLRIGQIPAQGTKDIYVRTNIPEGRTIGDEQGRLRIYWESEE